uniref:PDZ domain-containing protein n=1 Tax=Meloidogyne incognita TaxID=6306 RepID=A0A914KNJ0_MELIC
MWTNGHSFVFTSPIKSSMCEQLANGDGEIRKCEIFKDPKQGFGINIGGGTDAPYVKGNTGIFVSRVRRDELLDLICEGDRIIAVNDIILENKKHREAVSLLNSLEGVCTFTLERKSFNVNEIPPSESKVLTFSTQPSTLNETISNVNLASEGNTDIILENKHNLASESDTNIELQVPNSSENEVIGRQSSPVSEIISNDGNSVASESKDSNIEAPNSSENEVIGRQPSLADESISAGSYSVASECKDSSIEIRDPISAGNEVHDRKPSPVSELVFNDGYSVASENKDSNIEIRASNSSISEVLTITSTQPSTLNETISNGSYSLVSENKHANIELQVPNSSESEVIHRQPSPVKELMYSRKPSPLMELFFLGVGTCALLGLVFVGYRNLSKKSG